MIVTIDGPAGSGKSSAARGLAARLGFEVLDTGAMYRAVALAFIRNQVNERNPDAVRRQLDAIQIEMPPGRVILNGEDVTPLLRTPEISAASSRISAIADVRRFLSEIQRRVAAGRNMVCEGRDQGTVIFPDAECKFFFVADEKERARRRFHELQEQGSTFDQVLEAQRRRDRDDSQRELAPMQPAPDAIIVDTTNLSLDQVLDRLEQEVRSCVPISST